MYSAITPRFIQLELQFVVTIAGNILAKNPQPNTISFGLYHCEDTVIFVQSKYYIQLTASDLALNMWSYNWWLWDSKHKGNW